MRIAISGAHRVGKTSLAHALADALPGHVVVDEPYHDMVSEGHLFSHPPTMEDFEDQLGRSLLLVAGSGPDTIFDRCPIDFVAYLVADGRVEHDVSELCSEEVRTAMRSLDLVVRVPVESPDRIDCPDDRGLAYSRDAVDRELSVLLGGDRLELDVEVIEVRGLLQDRVTAVLAGLSPSQEEKV